MAIFIIISIVLLSIGIFMIILNHKYDLELVLVLYTAFTIVYMVLGLIFCFAFKSASVKAKIINKAFATEYSTEEIFWAEDVIDEIKQIKRQRIEANIKIGGEKNGI